MKATPVLVTKKAMDEGWFCEECPCLFEVGEIVIALIADTNADDGHICTNCAKNRLSFQTIKENREEISVLETRLKELELKK